MHFHFLRKRSHRRARTLNNSFVIKQNKRKVLSTMDGSGAISAQRLDNGNDEGQQGVETDQTSPLYLKYQKKRMDGDASVTLQHIL